jgi:hypothetical protein
MFPNEPAEEEERESKTGWAFGVVKLERREAVRTWSCWTNIILILPRAARPEHSARASRFFENEHFLARRETSPRERVFLFLREEIPPIAQFAK